MGPSLITAIPAIDIIDGHCVRLTAGLFDRVKVYDCDPVATAMTFSQSGAKRLHVVDLDAVQGAGNNWKTIVAIREAFPGVMEIGGGVRQAEDVKKLLDIGIDHIVIGTALVTKPQSVEQWVSHHERVFIAGIDASAGKVKISGWKQQSEMKAEDLALRARDLGMLELIYTNIERDGTMSGPDIDGAVSLADISGLPVIISGGIGSISDLEKLAKHPPCGVSGVIFGKALYEGRIDLSTALKVLGDEA